MATPGRLIRHDIASIHRSPASSWARDLADGRLSARKQLASSLREFHTQVLEPLWPAIERAIEADIRSRARQLATTGIAATVDALHPSIRWRDRVIEIDGHVNADIDLAGRGLQLKPTFWTRPGVPLRWAQPTLAYPIGPLVGDIPAATTSHRDHLAAVLGATRARVLRALVDEHTTSSLARAVGISLSSASTHAAALRDAGLVTSRRRGQSVHHALTHLGTQWTANDRPDDVWRPSA
jgi:DNA-binding transcriptional ArsR family regulator